MGYRKYIYLVEKEQYEKDKQSALKDEDCYFSPVGDGIEIYDETEIESFTAIEEFKDEEYSPKIINRKEFREIIEFYQEFIMNNAKEKRDRVKDTYKKVHNKEDLNSEENYEILSVKTWQNTIYNYFKDLKTQNRIISESGLFLLDYFYLVRMYEKYNEDEQVIIITHG